MAPDYINTNHPNGNDQQYSLENGFMVFNELHVPWILYLARKCNIYYVIKIRTMFPVKKLAPTKV